MFRRPNGLHDRGWFERLEERALLTPTATIVNAYAENAALVMVIDYLNTDPATLGNGDIQYSANGRAPVTSFVRSGPTLVNGKYRVTYGMVAYDGAWGATDTGAYRITTPPGEILGLQGQGMANLNLASYWLWFGQPKARLISQNLRPTDWLVTVQYDTLGALNESTIDNTDLTLVGGTPSSRSVVSINHLSATSLQVVYSFGAPGGSWNYASTGSYSILLSNNAVADTSGRVATGHGLASYYLWFNTPRAVMGPMSSDGTTLHSTVTFISAPSTAMNPAMLATAGVISVLGPNGYSQPGHITGLLHNPDGSYTATYTTPANGGSWDFRDSGLYSVRINPGTAQDFAGNSVAATIIGSATQTFTQPTATIQLPTFPTRTLWDLTINFVDDTAIDAGTVNTASIRLQGPDGGEIGLTLVGFGNSSGGTVVAHYRLTAPGGLDNGQYQIFINQDGVRDQQGNSANDGLIGSFWLFF